MPVPIPRWLHCGGRARYDTTTRPRLHITTQNREFASQVCIVSVAGTNSSKDSGGGGGGGSVPVWG